MGRLKSLIKNVVVNKAVKAHNCKRDKDHRIEAGSKRLRVKEGRSAAHYCQACGSASIESDIVKLQDLQRELNS
jgi:hypothetical protein